MPHNGRHSVQTARGCPTLRFDADIGGFNPFEEAVVVSSSVYVSRHAVLLGMWKTGKPTRTRYSGSAIGRIGEMTNVDGVIAV
jgi:hypothetical protein